MNIDEKEYIRSLVKQLLPIDDIMFRKMAESKAFCEELLRTVMDDPGLEVLEAKPQLDITNLLGRSVILDAYCELSDGRRVDIEVQQADNDDHQRRVRYNTSLLTANMAGKGTRFYDVPDVCSVYITRFDIFKRGLPVYHVVRRIDETDEPVFNGMSEIYINASAQGNSPIERLMRVFTQSGVTDAGFPVASAIKQRLTNSEEGEQTMCEIAEKLMDYGREKWMAAGRLEGRSEGRTEGRTEGRAEGHAEGKRDSIVELVQSGLLTAEQGAKQLKLSPEEFRRCMQTYAK